MNFIREGWFTERNDLWPGECYSLEVEKVLTHEKSNFQDVLVLQTKNHGRALILDGIIQCTEFDEFAYQEMISFLPLCAHPNPTNVLIVGGGDGGVAREVSKHPSVKTAVQVEIDAKVIEVSKQFLPNMSKGFNSPKLTLEVGDGFAYMKNHQNEFDVIITDSSDPIGPAVNLFTESYFKLLKSALKPGGIICSQGGTVWNEMEQVKKTIQNCKQHFEVVRYALASVPTYPTGTIGFVIASSDKNADLVNPKIKFSDKEIAEFNLKYYNTEIHSAAFALPNFIKAIL